MTFKIRILITLLIVIFLLLIVVILKSNTDNRQPLPVVTFSPTPLAIPQSTLQPSQQPSSYSDSYVRSALQHQAEQKQLLDQNQAVGRLLEKLPFQGVNFSLKFDYKTADFVAIINKDKQAEGNQELDNYLRSSGVQDRAWIKHFIVRYE